MNEENIVIGSAPVAGGRFPRHWKFACAAALAFGLIAAGSAADNREREDRDVWFVHASDPHIFLKRLQVDEKKDAEAAKKEREKKQRQEELNRKALADMLASVRSLPGGEGPSAFLVLTGDLGIDPCEIAKSEKPTASPTPAAKTPKQRGAKAGKDNTENTPAAPAAAADTTKQNKQGVPSVNDCLRVDEAEREKQVKITAEVLGQSPVPNIYLVAGNNDIANESAGDEALKYFNKFIDDVQAELRAKNSRVVLHNLTRCYASGEAAATCYADIADTEYRLIGFPSYSFKNEEKNAPDIAGQAKQLQTFRQLLEESQQAGKKVLVVTHTPEMDDPYLLAQERYINPTPTPTAAPTETPTPAGKATPAKKKKKEVVTTGATKGPGKKTAAQTQTNKPPSAVLTWNVSPEVRDGWKEAIASDSVVGVLAGHLHDPHKEIYKRPYKWSSGSQTAFQKLFLAPPLAVKNQDSSPIQARGFSLMHLRPDRVESQLFWYNSEAANFNPDPQPKKRWEHQGFWQGFCDRSHASITWLWNLDNADNSMVRMAVLLIAFLTAFLTIVAIWQIPPSSDPFAEDKKAAEDASKTTESASKTTQGASNASTDPSPFSNRFGKTVVAGLSGLAVTEVAKSLGNQEASADIRWYYIVWYILFFFLLLLALNLWRAAVEALRARVAVVYYPLARVGHVGTWDIFKHWLSSLRVPLLTASDTFINLIQGKNQTRTKVFEKTITDQQRNLVRVADSIRRSLSHLIEARVRQGRQPPPAQQEPAPEGGAAAPAAVPPLPNELDLVRVNISVLSKDQTSVFYISRAPGSSHSQFSKSSVAWVSVFTGQIRWYQSSYRPDYEKIVLFDNQTRNNKRVIPDENDLLMLKDHYQLRDDEDYQAFVVFPVPSPRREFGSDYVKGAIHISFRRDEDFDFVWDGNAIKPVVKPVTDPAKPVVEPPPIYYPAPQRMLEDWCKDEGIRAALNNSIAALGELLRGFNEIIYKNYIEANQPD